MNRNLSGATTSGPSGPGNNDNKGGTPRFTEIQECSLTIKSFNVISRTLVSGWSYPSLEIHFVYSTVPAD